MTKSIVALLALTVTANAQSVPWNSTAILPPIQYDAPYPGKIYIHRPESEEAVRKICYLSVFKTRAMGCSYITWPGECVIVIGSDELIKTVGLTYEVALRHEVGHCNGWPSDHPMPRYYYEPFRR